MSRPVCILGIILVGGGGEWYNRTMSEPVNLSGSRAIIPAIPLTKPWDKLPNEPSQWYARFVHYLMLPPGAHNMRQAYISYCRQADPDETQRKLDNGGIGRAPPSWTEPAKLYRWADRAGAYDNYHSRGLVQISDEERAAVKRESTEILRGVLRKMYTAILAADAKNIPLTTALSSLPRYVNELKQAYSTDPAQDQLSALDALPTPLRSAILVQIQAETVNLGAPGTPVDVIDGQLTGNST